MDSQPCGHPNEDLYSHIWALVVIHYHLKSVSTEIDEMREKETDQKVVLHWSYGSEKMAPISVIFTLNTSFTSFSSLFILIRMENSEHEENIGSQAVVRLSPGCFRRARESLQIRIIKLARAVAKVLSGRLCHRAEGNCQSEAIPVNILHRISLVLPRIPENAKLKEQRCDRFVHSWSGFISPASWVEQREPQREGPVSQLL